MLLYMVSADNALQTELIGVFAQAGHLLADIARLIVGVVLHLTLNAIIKNAISPQSQILNDAFKKQPTVYKVVWVPKSFAATSMLDFRTKSTNLSRKQFNSNP